MNKEQKTEPNTSETQIAELQAQCDEYLNGWKRARGDYVNLQKDTEEKMSNLAGFVKADLLSGLISILDNFAKAVSHVPEDQRKESWVVGIFHIKKQLEDFLNINGLEKIKTINEIFDPNLHEAVAKEPGEKEVILKEVSSGYKLNGRVIIPAKVVVGE